MNLQTTSRTLDIISTFLPDNLMESSTEKGSTIEDERFFLIYRPLIDS